MKRKEKEVVLATSISYDMTKKGKTMKERLGIPKASRNIRKAKALVEKENVSTTTRWGIASETAPSTLVLRRQLEVTNFMFVKHFVSLVYFLLLEF